MEPPSTSHDSSDTGIAPFAAFAIVAGGTSAPGLERIVEDAAKDLDLPVRLREPPGGNGPPAGHGLPAGTLVVGVTELAVERLARAAVLRSFGERFRAAVEERGGSATWVAVGGPSDESRPGESCVRESLQALRFGRRLFSAPSVVLYSDMLPAVAIDADPTTRSRLVRTLDPLARSRRGTTLLETLETYFDSDLDQHRAAERLRVHRHTIGYRISRAERLLGRSVRSGPDRLLIELALRARALGESERRQE